MEFENFDNSAKKAHAVICGVKKFLTAIVYIVFVYLKALPKCKLTCTTKFISD